MTGMDSAQRWADEKTMNAALRRELELHALATTQALLARCTRCDHLLTNHTAGCTEPGCDCRHTPKRRKATQ